MLLFKYFTKLVFDQTKEVVFKIFGNYSKRRSIWSICACENWKTKTFPKTILHNDFILRRYQLTNSNDLL